MCDWVEEKGIYINDNILLFFHSELEKEVYEHSVTDIKALEMP